MQSFTISTIEWQKFKSLQFNNMFLESVLYYLKEKKLKHSIDDISNCN